MPQEAVDFVVSLGGSALGFLTLLFGYLKWRNGKDAAIEERVRKQELKCEGTSSMVLTRLSNLDSLQAEQNGQLKELNTTVGGVAGDVRWLVARAKNGDGGERFP